MRVVEVPQKGLGVLASRPLAARTTVAYYLIKAFDSSSHQKSEYSIKPMKSTRLVFGEGKIGDVFGGSLLPPGPAHPLHTSVRVALNLAVRGSRSDLSLFTRSLAEEGVPYVGFLLNEPSYPSELSENCELVNDSDRPSAEGTFRMALRTVCDVPSGAELTVDYGPHYHRMYASKYDAIAVD